MDQELRDRLAAFADLDDDALATLVTDVAAAYGTIRAGENPRAELATLTELAGAREYLVAVQAERTSEAERLATEEAERIAAEEAALAALDAQFEDSDTDPEEEESTDDESEDETTEEETQDEEEAAMETPVPVAAAARPSAAAAAAHVPEARRSKPKAAERRGRVVSLAGGAIGNDLNGLGEIGAAVARQARNFIGGSGSGGGAEKVPVARIIADYPEERRLGLGDGYAETNQAKIEAVGAGGPTPLAAAGGICIPAQPYYDSAVVATDARPVVAALQPFQTRGGVSFIPPTSVADYTVNEWTLANDEAVSSASEGTWKTVQSITCGAVTTVRPHAVVGIWEFGNLNEMTNPERTSAEMVNAMAAYARKGDELLLRDIRAGSTRLNAPGLGGQAIGAARDTLVSMGQAATAYRNRYRMDPATTLNVLAPAWLRDAIQLDLAVQQPGDNKFVSALSEVNGYLGAINVRPYWYLDSPPSTGSGAGPTQYFGAATAGQSIPAFPGYAQWGLFHDGAWLYGDQGEIELGPIRDSALNRRNAYQMFVEGFELAAMVGVASWWVTQIVAIAGGFGTGEDLGS